MAIGSTQSDFSFGKPTGVRSTDAEALFRIVVLADLGSAATLHFAQHKPLLVDIDGKYRVRAPSMRNGVADEPGPTVSVTHQFIV
jgi:hypothetical protein